MDDLQIIELYFNRDENAVKETARKYGSYCFTVANHILACEPDAEECVNDTYLRTWQSVPPVRPSSLRLFLAKITRNLAFNTYKAKHREKRGAGELPLALSEMEEFLADTCDITEELRLAELKSSVNRFLRSLPDRDRGIFLRRYFFVEDTETIAARYAVTEANVRLILSRTRKKLKIHLQKEGYTI